GRVKTLGHAERIERRSSPAPMSSRAVARQHGNRGAGRTRFPSVNALSEFLTQPGRVSLIDGRWHDPAIQNVSARSLNYQLAQTGTAMEETSLNPTEGTGGGLEHAP